MVANFEVLFSEPFSKFIIFFVSIIHMIVAEFCEKLIVVSFDFLVIKNMLFHV